jgi:hypothetical protein
MLKLARELGFEQYPSRQDGEGTRGIFLPLT